MRHPLESWFTPGRLIAVLIVTGAVWAGLIAVNTGLEDGTAGGILDLQFAGDTDRVVELVDSWREEGVIHKAGFNLGLDFLFMPLYSTALALGAVGLGRALRRRQWDRLATAGVLVAWAGWLAGAFDAAETAPQLAWLGNPAAGVSPALVLVFASIKYALIGVVALYLVGVGLSAWFARALRG